MHIILIENKRLLSGTLIYNRLQFPNKCSYCVSVFRRGDQTPKRIYSSPFTMSDQKPLLHYIGSGRIAITFNQPVFIHVLQFYLWNFDERFYRYFVQISKNLIDWETVCDFRNEWRYGLQTVEITQNLISIRITGTDVYPNHRDTVYGDKEFRIIHLDFPDI